VGVELELGVLGPFEVRIDGGAPLPLGGLRQRALLAVLALRANEVISTDRLIDELWGENAPARAVHTVQVFVSRLRRALDDAGERLLTRPPGYVLELGVDELDSVRFERLYQAGRGALSEGDLARAAALLDEAQTLWRGPPLADFTYEPFAQAMIVRLEELRLGCREELIETQIALGHQGEVIPELEAFVREQPLRERPYGQLMLALYRCGRQSDALETYQHARRTLIDELGVEPGPALRDLVGLILEQDASLEPEPVVPITALTRGRVSDTAEPERRADDRSDVEDATTTPDGSAQPRELHRRNSTVLAVRLSTRREVDPERARSVIAWAEQVLDEAVRRYGGALVSGGAHGEWLGVFGFPQTREDDALCALQGTDDFRARIASDRRPRGAQIIARIGVYTGELVGTGLDDLYGPAVERALTLASAADDDEVLISDETRLVVGGAATIEAIDDGATWRLVGLAAQQPALEHPDEPPMFGRARELGEALDIFTRASQEATAHLLTVVGDAGIGKSRFAHEVVDLVEAGATVLGGRCLPYGEGVTYWPLREAVTTVAGGQSKEAIEDLFVGLADAGLLAGITATALGLTSGETTSEQVPWAIRRLLENLAAKGPLLLVIEDAHWAQDPLLDLVDYLIDWLASPVTILCLTRPELLEARPRWRGGDERVHSIVLRPLPDEQGQRLVEHHLGRRELSAATRARILDTAEGNPLFVEQLLAIADDDRGITFDAELPATIQRLLAARLDRLGPAERAFVTRAALIGREFPFSAVVALLPPEARPSADEHLRSLVRRGFIKPHRSALAGEEQLRFHHILIQDVAYRSTPKALRAELHERFADWLAPHGDTYDEFVGYHLEQAFRYRAELGEAGAADLALAARAGDGLAAAGRRAAARGESIAAVRLLRSATEMFDAAHEPRPDALLDLGVAMRDCGELHEAERVLGESLAASVAADSSILVARAEIEIVALRAGVDPTVSIEQGEAVAQRALGVFTAARDEAGLALALTQMAEAHWARCHFEDMERVLEQAVVHAEGVSGRERAVVLRGLARAAVMGPRPVEDALRRCQAVLDASHGNIPLTAIAEAMMAVLYAMRGDADAARALSEQSQQRIEELGLDVHAALQLMYRAFVELVTESPQEISAQLMRACDLLVSIGESNRLSTLAALLARLLYIQGRYDECDRFCRLSSGLAADDDVVSQVLWRGAAGKLMARKGDVAAARRLADTAVTLAQQTDFLLIHGDALRDRAEILAAAGEREHAIDDLGMAGSLFERKGIVALAAKARALRAHLSDTPVAGRNAASLLS
jgi:DNA-binding SARP family transcriptional activator